MSTEFQLIHANSDLTKLQVEWNKNLPVISGGCFVNEFEWFSSYIASHGDELTDCFFLIARHDGNLQAICPIQYRVVSQLGLKLKAWQIFWSNDMRICDFPLRRDESNHNFLNKLTEYLRNDKQHPWHLLQLGRIREDSNIYHILNQNWLNRAVCKFSHQSKYIACKSSYEESVEKISSKFKRNNRRKLRKLEKMGTVSFSLVDSGEVLNTAFEQFLDVEAGSWKGEGKSAIKQKPKQHQFYKELVNRFSANKQCLIHTLLLDEEPIASQLALIAGETLNLLKIGYKREFNAIGPGTILLDETIRQFSGHKTVKKISFVTGASWNDGWEPVVSNVYTCDAYNNSLKGVSAYLLDRLKEKLRTYKILIMLKNWLTNLIKR